MNKFKLAKDAVQTYAIFNYAAGLKSLITENDVFDYVADMKKMNCSVYLDEKQFNLYVIAADNKQQNEEMKANKYKKL